MSVVVAKFGGSSLADAEQIIKMKNIVRSDENRRYVVPSAPGKRNDEDVKVTDLFYTLYREPKKEGCGAYRAILKRFSKIRDDLGLGMDIEKHIADILVHLKEGASEDYAASRGEYLNGLLIADFLRYDFVDPAGYIFFKETGVYDHAKTVAALSAKLKMHERAVIPGFYGSLPDGTVKTFSRGGSDITGSIVACAAGASLYENWTDVSGFLKADPRIVENPKKIDTITYRELRELSYMGATVLHEDAIFPVLEGAIPICVKNTNNPDDPGTRIVPTLDADTDDLSGESITGIAGKKNFTVITIEKNGMNAEIGFGRKVLSCLETFDIPFEHIPSGIDSLCVVIADCRIDGCSTQLIDEIHRVCNPDSVEVSSNMALIATVGRGMIRKVGISAKLFTALAEGGVNVRMIDQGSSEMNIIVGVENDDFEKAVRAIYDALV